MSENIASIIQRQLQINSLYEMVDRTQMYLDKVREQIRALENLVEREAGLR